MLLILSTAKEGEIARKMTKKDQTIQEGQVNEDSKLKESK